MAIVSPHERSDMREGGAVCARRPCHVANHLRCVLAAHCRSNRGDLHDFDVFADRTLASGARAGIFGRVTERDHRRPQCPLVVLRPKRSRALRRGSGRQCGGPDRRSVGPAGWVRGGDGAGHRLTVLSTPTQLSSEPGSVVTDDHGSSRAVALYAQQFPDVLVRHLVLDPPTRGRGPGRERLWS